MRLKGVLINKGIKQKWLAERIGVSQVTMTNWVKGKSIPSKKNIEKLCEVLNVTVKDLLIDNKGNT